MNITNTMITCKLSLFCLLSYITCFSDPLIYYHIPKTGGTTVVTLLEQHYHKSKIFPIHDQKSMKNIKNTSSYSIITGHFFFNYGNIAFPQDSRNVTFLRDPVERILSDYRFIMQAGFSTNDIQYGFHGKGPQPFEITHPQTDFGVNSYCYGLSSYSQDDPNVSLNLHLESAKANLSNRFFFVGITEKMDESICLLYQLMGWDNPPYPVPKLNTTVKKPVDDATREKIKELNWADIELYEYAKNLYEQQREWIQKNISIQPKRKFPSAYSYQNNKNFEGSGWIIDENSERWSGPELEAYIDIPLDPTNNYTLKFTAFAPIDILRKLQVFINDHPIALRSMLMNNKFRFSGKIPSEFLISGEKTRITFKTHRTCQSDGINRNYKNKDLQGICLKTLEIFKSN